MFGYLQLNQLSEELRCLHADKEQNAEAANCAEELLTTLSSVTAERDWLRTDLQENVQMVRDCMALCIC